MGTLENDLVGVREILVDACGRLSKITDEVAESLPATGTFDYPSDDDGVLDDLANDYGTTMITESQPTPMIVAKIGDRIKNDGKWWAVVERGQEDDVLPSFAIRAGRALHSSTATDVYTSEEHARNSALIHLAISDYGSLIDDLINVPLDLRVQHGYSTKVGAYAARFWLLTPDAVEALGEFRPLECPCTCHRGAE